MFFAGHSQTEGKTGRIYLNEDTTNNSLTIEQLQASLKIAIANGLKLAIFNSCDGLGLADELKGVGVPQMIVMREPVPDEVARQFLKYFLEDFSQGNSLYIAVRNARQRLEWMEDEFPCASWLPVICQNPAAHPLIWAESPIKHLKKWVIGGIAVTLILTGNYIRESLLEANEINNYIPISTKNQPNPKPSIKSPETLQGLGDNFSWGEQILIRYDYNFNINKKAGVKAFANKEYIKAAEHFKKSLNVKPNDPETQIYLNNAVAEQVSKINLLPLPNTLKSSLNSCSLIYSSNNNQILKIAAPVPIGAESHIARDLLRGVAQIGRASRKEKIIISEVAI